MSSSLTDLTPGGGCGTRAPVSCQETSRFSTSKSPQASSRPLSSSSISFGTKSSRVMVAVILVLTLMIIALIISDTIVLHHISRSVETGNLNQINSSQHQNNLLAAASSSHGDATAAVSPSGGRFRSRNYSQRSRDKDTDDDDHHEHQADDANHDDNHDFFSHDQQHYPSRNKHERSKNKYPSSTTSEDFDRGFRTGYNYNNPTSSPPPTQSTFGTTEQPFANLNRPSNNQADPVCMSAGCVRAAAQILNNIDNQTNPCENFYRFSCGRWIDTQVIPDEKTSLSVFSQITADLNIQLRALVSAKPAPSDAPIVGQMRNLYSSCMNLSEIEARGDEPLLEVLRDLGGWPVLTQSLASAETTTTSSGPMTTTTTATTSSVLQRRSAAPTLAGTSRRTAPSTTPMPLTTKPANNVVQQQRRAVSPRNARLARQSPPSDQAEPSNRQHQNQWLDTLIKLRRRGFSHDMIIDLSVMVDIRNNSRFIIELDQSSLGMPDRGYYFKAMNDTTVAAYYKLMVDSAVMLGAPVGEARAQMREAFDFETQLAMISISRESRRNVSRMYNKKKAIELYELAPNIDWKRYLRSLLNEPNLNMEQEDVIVKVPTFLQKLDALLVKTPPRVITNYIIWRIVRHSMISLGRKWRELAHNYNSVNTGRQVEEPRWEICLSSLQGTLLTALSALYVKNHFNQASKETAMEMVEYIRGEFLQMLDEVDWMDEETRQEAKLKAQAISPYIGYPDELLNDSLVEEFYAGLSLSRSNYYQNLRQLRVWSTNFAFSQLRKQNKRGDWKKHSRAAVVNAFYNSLENSIEFPAGILRGAFFDAERPNYMNFGAIGYVIGHEITHGFDDRGRQYDKDGQDRFWWKPKTDARFRERAQCIIEQYGNYTVKETGLNVNGLNTQGENIADNGGIKESYRAYQRWTRDHGKEARLPGLNYTPDQLFWISAANIWCGKFRPEMLKLRVNSGVHSPAEFRIIGPFSNSVDFSKSFNCPLGSPMNPHKKCTVW